MKLKNTLPVILAALMLASAATAVSAAGTKTPAGETEAPEVVEFPPETEAAETTDDEPPAIATVKGKYPSRVTSFRVESPLDPSPMFDKKASTAYDIYFANCAVHRTHVDVALQSPAVVDTFAVMLSTVPEDSIVNISVYASNDTLQEEWTPIKAEETEEQDGFKIYKLEKFARKFTYYRFEFSMPAEIQECDDLSIAELQLFGDKTPAMKYDISGGEVEPGTLPPLVPVTEEKEVNKAVRDRFMFASLPITKLPQ